MSGNKGDRGREREMAKKVAIFDDDFKELRPSTGLIAKVVSVFAIAYTSLEILALQFVVIDLWVFIALVMIAVMVLGFLTIPFGPKDAGKVKTLDWLFMAMGVAPCVYILIEMERLQWTYGSTVLPLDMFFSVMFMIPLLELVRRAFGWAIPITALAFLAYAFLGSLLPSSLFGHRGVRIGNVIGFMLGPMAIFGMVMSAMVQIIFLFMMFSTFLQKCGAGNFFADFANSVAGQYRGGPAKVSVFSSSLFGMISGSSVANVAIDGGITIPLMIKTGFKPTFAGAMEATASTGGQIMPPIMGAGAFIMAELLSISYRDVIMAAAIPAVLYYVALYCMADLEAVRHGLRGLSKLQLPRKWQVLKDGWHLLIPVIILLYELVVLGASMSRAGLLSIASIVVVSWFRKKTRLTFLQVIEAMVDTALSTVALAAMCGCAGIIVGVVAITGLGVAFGSAIVPLSGGNLFVCLLMTAVLCILLGMGLPTTASYIVAASIGVSALSKLGVNPLAAHLFIFYFACISSITPPDMAAIFTACGFSKADPIKTGWTAMRLAFPAYIVPFIFVYHPVLLMKGSVLDVSYQFIMSCLGVAAMSMALVGISYFGNIKWGVFSRIFFAASFFAFIIPGWQSDLWASFAIVIGFTINSQARGMIYKGA